MTDEVEQNSTIDSTDSEQITKVPIAPPNIPKVKDPKKIAAGKKLAAYNKKAKQKQKLIQNSDSDSINTESDENNSGNFVWPEIGITSLIAIIGLALSGIDLFFRYKNSEAATFGGKDKYQNSGAATFSGKNKDSDFEDFKIKESNKQPEQIGGME